MKRMIAYTVLAIVVIGGGCIGTISEHGTPARIDGDAVDYVVEAGIGDAADYKGFLFPSLAELKRLRIDLNAAYDVNVQEIQHLAEQHQLAFKYLGGIIDGDIELAKAREDFIFNPTTGALAIGLSLAGIGAGGYLGLMRKRPQDITPAEMETALGDVRGEVDDRDRKIISLVASMRNVIDAQPADAQRHMKEILKAGQSPETRVAVKQALAQL